MLSNKGAIKYALHACVYTILASATIKIYLHAGLAIFSSRRPYFSIKNFGTTIFQEQNFSDMQMEE